MWNGGLVNGGDTGLVGGEVGFHWKESHRQEWDPKEGLLEDKAALETTS